MTNPNEARTQLAWVGGMRFDTGRRDGPAIRLDAAAETGPGPLDTLLCALMACSASDVVDILEKGRTPVESLTVNCVGQRATTSPRRLQSITLNYAINGPGIDEARARRAVDLALDKYCSVRHSLDPNIAIDCTVAVGKSAAHPA